MNKIVLFSLIALIGIVLFVFWKNKKKKTNSIEKSTSCSIGDNCREIKTIPLIKCSDCNGYHTENKESGCCSACHSITNYRLGNEVNHCHQHHHRHGHNCYSEFKQTSIECGYLWWLVPLILGVMIYQLARRHHK